MDNFFQEVWSTLEDELQEKRPGALMSASAPERRSDERRFSIRGGDQSNTLIVGPRLMDRKDAPHVQHTIRWSDAAPLVKLSNEDLQDLLNEARDDFH